MTNVPSLDYSGLHKWLASAGIALLVADGVLGWALLQTSGVLLIKGNEVQSLTEAGRSGVARQQVMLGWLLDWWPIFALVIALLGAVLIALGVWQWVPRQRISNQKEEIEFAKLRKATQEELLQQRLVDTAEQMADARAGGTEDEMTGESTRSLALFSAPGRPRLEAAEEIVQSAFVSAYEEEFTVEHGLAVDSPSGSARVDILLIPRNPSGPAVAVEVKVLTSPVSPTLFRIWFERTASAASATSAALGRPTDGLLVLVLSPGVAPPATLYSGRPAHEPEGRVSVLVLTWETVNTLDNDPTILRRLLTD